MLVPVQRTWVVGEIVTAAYLNSNVRDAANFLLEPPLADVAQSVAQSLATSVVVPLLMDVEVYDNDATHSIVTNTSRLTIQTAGWYHYEGLYIAAANATGVRLASLLKNGVLHKTGARVSAAAAGPTACVVSGYVSATVGDYLEVAGLQSSTVSLNTDVTTHGRPGLTIRWVSS